MDIRYFVDKGYSFDDILREVKKEYESESKRKNEENKKRAAAEAEKLKRKTARAALMKAWRDYTLVVAKDITPAEADKLMAEIEENLVDFENTFPLSMGHIRKDGEQWTPYLQPVIMLVQLAYRAKLVSYEGRLTPMTIIKVND